jgi:hypothetical protein
MTWAEFLELYNDWVSASDLLPPEEVLVLTVGMVDGNAETYRVAFRRGESWFLQVCGQTFKIVTVTHWRALPQPPEQIVLE